MIAVGDYFSLNRDIEIIDINGNVQLLNKYSLLQVKLLEESKTVLHSVEHDFDYDVGGLAYGLIYDGGPYETYKDVYQEASTHYGSVTAILNKKQIMQINNPLIIEAWADEVVHDNVSHVQKYKAGNVKLFGFFVGQVMKISKNRANPAITNEILKKKLEC